MIDPEQLEQEADELLLQQQNPDTPVEQEPEPVADTSNEPAPEAKPEVKPESENTVSEERYLNAEARMHQAMEETAALRKEVEALKESKEQAPEQQAKDTPDDLDGLLQDYPEIVGPLVNKLRAMEKLLGDVKQSNDDIQSTNAQSAQDSHITAIQQVHPDLVEVVNTPDFQGWQARQSNVIQQAIKNGSADDVIYVLNQYKQQMGIGQKEQPQSKLDQARKIATPNVGGAKPNSQGQTKYTRESIAAMSTEQFAKHESAIDEAMAQGLID